MNTGKLGLSRIQWILSAALAVQIILAVAANWPRSAQAGGGPLIAGFDPAAISEIVVENQTGASLRLAKVGGVWALPDAGNFAVRAEKVDEVLGKIQRVQTNRLVAETAASHAQLEVADEKFQNRVTLRDGGGQTWVVLLGSSAGAAATHIRLAGQNPVYLTSELASWELSPSANSWIDTTYFTVEEAQIRALTVTNANGVFEFTRDDAGTWSFGGLAAGDVFDPQALQTVLNTLTRVSMLEPLGTEAGDELGFAQPTAAATLQLVDSSGTASTLTFTIGALQGETTYAAKASNSLYYVKVSSYTAQGLVEMAYASLIEAQPTATPAAQETPQATTTP